MEAFSSRNSKSIPSSRPSKHQGFHQSRVENGYPSCEEQLKMLSSKRTCRAIQEVIHSWLINEVQQIFHTPYFKIPQTFNCAQLKSMLSYSQYPVSIYSLSHSLTICVGVLILSTLQGWRIRWRHSQGTPTATHSPWVACERVSVSYS